MIQKKCNFCERTEFKHIGAYNLHMMHCEAKAIKAERQATKQIQEQPKKEKGCEHEWKLLDSKVAAHRAAMAEGYTMYCENCYEVGK